MSNFIRFTMAVECSQEAILNFLRERGGRVKNAEFVEHFKAVFPSDPKLKAEVRELFKSYVDTVAFVKTDDGVKYVCLKKKFREESSLKDEKGSENSGQVSGRDVNNKLAVTGSNYNKRAKEVPHVLVTLEDSKQAQSDCNVGVIVKDSSTKTMGNRGSVKREKRSSKTEEKSAVDIPVITVIEPSPLPVQESVFNLPEPEENSNKGETLGLTQTKKQVTTPEEFNQQQQDQGKCSDVDDDARSLSGSDDTPKGSRKHFIQVMMNTSPQVRRNIGLRKSSLTLSDSDSASISSCNLEDDRQSIALDPLEHEWMLCASDAEWGSLQTLLNSDPGLVLKKDFVTGFTCLHWAAKQGKPELIALIINFGKQHHIPISIDVRSSTGYTPLHIAAMHNHMDVVKLLVGAYNADVEIRDYSGRKACQYLTDNVSVDIRDIIGAYEVETENRPQAEGKRWRFNKVLQVKPKPMRRLNSTGGDCDSIDGAAGEQPLKRRSSLGRMRPKLQKLKWRTSQLVHSTTFHGTADLQKRLGSRPKTHFFG